MLHIGLALGILGLVNAGIIDSTCNGTELQMLEKRVAGLELGLANMMTVFHNRIARVEKLVSNNNEKCGGFVIDGKCFTVIIIGSGGINYYDAKRFCTYDGLSKIGNIYTLQHFNQLRDHVMKRKGETRLTFINVWTDMTREIPGGDIILSNGAVAAYQGQGNLRNKNEWRTDEARRTNVYVSFWTDGLSHTSNPGGYGNVWPTFTWHAALCERPV